MWVVWPGGKEDAALGELFLVTPRLSPVVQLFLLIPHPSLWETVGLEAKKTFISTRRCSLTVPVQGAEGSFHRLLQ